MPDEIVDQLRRYGEAVERSIPPADPDVAVVVPVPATRPRRWVLAAAACLAALVGAAVIVEIAGHDDAPTAVDTTGTMPAPAPSVALGSAVRGTATWTGPSDPRATFGVAACPATNQTRNCPGTRTAVVGADGRFELDLPAGSGEWRVAAYVSADQGCIFDCDWRSAQLGPSVTVLASQPPQDLRLTVTARVVGLFVRDRDGNPFAVGGVHVNDVRCPTECVGTDLAPMFMTASPADGAVTVVMDPSLTYDVFAQAVGTGWPGGTDINGQRMWFSSTSRTPGSDLPEGTVIRVDGGPARGQGA